MDIKEEIINKYCRDGFGVVHERDIPELLKKYEITDATLKEILEECNCQIYKVKPSKLIEQLNKYSTVITLVFSLLLVVVGFLQYGIYNRQANISANANKLAQYQYRFEFYEKLQDLQKEVSTIKEKPQLELDQFSKLTYEILSLIRESTFLFDKGISDDINIILNEHLEFLLELNNEGMYYGDYENEMNKLNSDYGDFINSDDFKEYLDINAME